jgi:predicted dehydrogenase
MNRRYFLFGTMAAAARPAFSQNTTAASDNVGVGIIGVGNRGSHTMRGVMDQPGVTIRAICDIKPDRLDKAATAAAASNPRTFRDYKELLALNDVDAVYISTPCDLHVEMAIAALKAGKHVYLEKPVGITPESINDLVKVAKTTKPILHVGQQRRSEKRLQNTIQKIQDGAAGKIVMVKAQRHAGNDLAHDGPSADWFFNSKRSGDVIVEMAVHNLDVCNWAIGSRPERAGGFGGNLVWVNDPPGRNTMDGYSLTYDYANGVKMSFTQVFFHPNGMPGGGQYTYIFTDKGGVDLDSATFYPRERGATPVVLSEKVQENRNAHTEAFFDAIRNGKKSPADISIGATAALTAIMGREAIYQKKTIAWSDMRVNL